MSTDISDKLLYPQFEKMVKEVPMQVMYQVASNDTYTSSGYSFYIKSPGKGMLLDSDIWIKYTLSLTDLANNAISGLFGSPAADDAFANIAAASNVRLAFRSGFAIQKATQSMLVIINGLSLTNEPWKFVDVLNKLYISDDQSRHEFSSSGGKYDNGNHGHRTASDISVVGITDAAILNNQTLGINIGGGFHTAAEIQLTGATRIAPCYTPAPLSDYFYNEGFTDRHFKLADIIRRSQAPNAQTGVQYGPNAASTTYTITVYERLPIGPFKMYSNDEIFGVIPHINDLTIRGMFSSNFLANVMRSSASVAAICSLSVPANASGSSQCELYLKWYTPPQSFPIPQQISLPLRKINVWSTSKTIVALAAADNPGTMSAVSEYNISLDAIPDLLLIYYKYRVDSILSNMPDSYHFEITDLRLSIEGASGKVSLIQTIDLYNKWKSYLRHEDTKLPQFDEWRRYTCVAVLKPEDYGCLRGPGYDNPVTLGVQFTPFNWWNIPKLGLIPSNNYTGTAAELIVTSIYDRWSLTIKESGGASSQNTKEVSMMRQPSLSTIQNMERPPMENLRGNMIF